MIVEDIIGTDLNSWVSYVLVGRLIEDLHASQQSEGRKHTVQKENFGFHVEIVLILGYELSSKINTVISNIRWRYEAF